MEHMSYNFQTAAIITVSQLMLSQFTTKQILWTFFYVLQKEVMLSNRLGIDAFNSTQQLKWDDIYIPMVPKGQWKN